MNREETIYVLNELLEKVKASQNKTNILVKEKHALEFAIEALNRPHGEWIYHAEWYSDGECAFECSKCGMGVDVDYNFCPNCGADMRGEAE